MAAAAGPDGRVYTLKVRGGDRTIRVPEGAAIDTNAIIESVPGGPAPARLRYPDGVGYYFSWSVLVLADGSRTAIRYDGEPGINEPQFGWLWDALR